MATRIASLWGLASSTLSCGSCYNLQMLSGRTFETAFTWRMHIAAFQQWRYFIQMRTNLKVVDNSGAKRIMCIQALKGKKGARLGDTIIASVKEVQPFKVTKGAKAQSTKEKVKKGDVVYAVVVRAAMQRGRCDGSEIKFDDNAAVLVNKQGEPIGSRILGPVPHELRRKKHGKILSLAEHIV